MSVDEDIEKKSFRPLVSIIIPVFNGSNYLNDAIDSALSQEYDNIEVLVIDDGSTDNGQTENIAIGYGACIRYFHKSNGGVATALNLGITEMKGEYFSWLSHDDIYYPTKISEQIKLLESLENKRDIVFSGFDVVNDEKQKLNRILPLERYSKAKLEVPLFALFRGMISGCSLLIHKSHFDKHGLFREDLPTTQDFDMWFRIMRNQPSRICSGVSHKVRVHEMQKSRQHGNAHNRESNTLWIGIMEALDDEEKIQLDGSVERFYQEMYWMLLKYSKSDKAVQHAKQRTISQDGVRGIFSKFIFWLATALSLLFAAVGRIKRRMLGVSRNAL